MVVMSWQEVNQPLGLSRFANFERLEAYFAWFQRGQSSQVAGRVAPPPVSPPPPPLLPPPEPESRGPAAGAGGPPRTHVGGVSDEVRYASDQLDALG